MKIKPATRAGLFIGVSLMALAASPALAEGTSAGTTITNTATVDYQVGGVNQTAVIGSDDFVVDRKINVLVIDQDSAATTVFPGQSDAVLGYTVTNLSNATVDLALSVAQSATDDFDVSTIRLYRDDGNGTFDAGDTLVTFLDEVAEDESVLVFLVSNVPLSALNAQTAGLVLTATAHEGGGVGSQGSQITATSGPDTTSVDTVLADGAGETDSPNDGAFSAQDIYTTFAASLSVTKTSIVISDPVNAASNPKAIPGAIVEYCVIVSNAAASATATNVTVTDVLPGDLTFNNGFGIFVNGTVDGSNACLADGTPGGSFSAGEVTAALPDIAASETRTVYFRATIN